jgi:hypothetical protein
MQPLPELFKRDPQIREFLEAPALIEDGHDIQTLPVAASVLCR